jgi:hypothetical protein
MAALRGEKIAMPTVIPCERRDSIGWVGEVHDDAG